MPRQHPKRFEYQTSTRPRKWVQTDNGLVFTSRSYTALVENYGLQQESITPYSQEQKGMVERAIRTLKDQCVHRHRYETLQHTGRVIADWIGFYNHRRPHQALAMTISPRWLML